MIRVSRGFVLVLLAALTLFFLWAAYIIWNNGFPEPMRARISNVITTPTNAAASPTAPVQTHSIRLTVYETGIAAVSANEIRQANLEFDDLSNQTLNLTYMGDSVPFFVVGEGENAHLLFYAQAHTSALEAPAVYKLEHGAGHAMAQRNAHPNGQGTPVITVVAPSDTAVGSDTIYIDSVQLKYSGGVSTANRQAHFSSDSAQIAIQDATESTLVFDVTNATDPILLTNLLYADNAIHFASDGSQRQFFALDSAQTVHPTIESVSQWEISLRDPSRSADYIAIVPDMLGFQASLNPLLEYRAQQGLRTVSIPVEQIFEEFGYGHHSPTAIKAFLAYASQNWTPPTPKYVLLAGDATYDLRNQIPSSNKNLLPTPMVHTEGGRYLTSDSWYGHFDQTTFDQNSDEPTTLSQLAIGRFPAQNPVQLRNMVEKTLQYENGTNPDSNWAESILLIADDQPEFESISKVVTHILNEAGFDVYQLNMRNNTYITHDIISTINRGVGFVNYTGYGGERIWGDEAILQTSDVQKFKNEMRPPILTTFTTRNGAFADPQQDTLVESLLQANNRGIVAAVAPSGQPLMDRQIPLAEQFYMQLVNAEQPTLGAALLQMQNNAANDPALQEIMPTLNLLGDPALRIHLP
ncbi:MAG: hypothetical protein KDE48_08815 [Anaerolineales bacterium]|nr:hypothetical protein [Anaerolineales bacterium]